jgi:hypothetical protein
LSEPSILRSCKPLNAETVKLERFQMQTKK